MKCPFCQHENTEVRDSRATDNKSAVRRRRECVSCNERFTTFEHVNLRELQVIKRDGKKEQFMRSKLENSISISLSRRNISEEHLQATVNKIVQNLESIGDRTVSSKQIGALVMQYLVNIDLVAYVRFASVYCNFQKIKDFSNFIESQLYMEHLDDKSKPSKDGK